jgi:hypothetical protein
MKYPDPTSRSRRKLRNTGSKAGKHSAAIFEAMRSLRICWFLARRDLEKGKVPWQVPNRRFDHNKLKRRLLPDDNVFHQLASYAHLPAAEVEKMQRGVSYEVDQVWQDYCELPYWKPGEPARVLKQLRRVKKLSGEFSAAVKGLDSGALMFLRISAYLRDPSAKDGPKTRQEIVEDLKFIHNLADWFSTALSIALDKQPANPVGRPAGGGLTMTSAPSLARFVLALLWDVRAAGGRLSLDKNAGTGGLIEALELLRPYLPPGFVPICAPLSTLTKIKTLDNKFALTPDFAEYI